jgi:hypothetical protein
VRPVCLVACVLVIGASRAGGAAPFDLAACARTVAAPGSGAALADGGAERGGPPPPSTRFALLDARARTASAAAIAAAFPASWHARVELDATGMVHQLQLALPGKLAPAELAPVVLGLVRAHPCLFGVIDPAQVAAHVYIDRYIMLDVRPHAVGGIGVASDVSRDGTTTVTLTGHLWPVAEPAIAVEPARLLRRYLGHELTQRIELFGTAYTAPGTMIRHSKALTQDFRWQPGPILVCGHGGLDVRAGVWVEVAGTADHDPVIRELPAPLDPQAGRPIAGAWIMPIVVDPDENYTPEDRTNAAGQACLGLPTT